MAVMTHARTSPTSVDYRDLNATQQAQFDLVMDLADDTTSAGQYNSLMLAAASIAGIHIERGGEVLPCKCTCVCPAIFNNADTDARTIEDPQGFNLPIRQCPLCADRHPAPDVN